MNKKCLKNRLLAEITSVLFIVTALLIPSSGALAVPRAGDIREEKPLSLAMFVDDEKRPLRKSANENQDEGVSSGWAFYFHNDLFASTSNDRDYTGGLSFTLSGPRATGYLFSVDPVLGVVNNWLGFAGKNDATLHSFEFGLTAFTPENIEAATPVFDDRPYSGLIYVSSVRQSVDYRNRTSVISSLTIGALGLNLAGEFQNTIHKVVDSDQAQGWGNQISDGGELTFRYSISKQQVHWADYSASDDNYEIKTAHQANVGYLTDVSWSVSARFGKIRTPWASFNPQNAAYAEKSAPLAKLNTQPKNELYFWTGLSIHLRAYNALLQGQFRESSVTYGSDELNHVVSEAWMGITSELDNGLRLSYFLRGQSSEIKSGPGSRHPVWGGVIVSRSI